MRKLGESLLQTTEQLKAPQRISLTLLNRAQQIRNSSAARVEAAQGRLAERNARNRALNDHATLEGDKDGGIAFQAARDAIAFVKENPLEAADLAASFTEPYGTARDVVDIGAGTASALYNEATGDRENANAGWLQATTGGAAVLVPFASGVAIRKGMDVYDYAKATRRRAGNPDTAEGLGELMSHPKASPNLPRKGSFEQSYPEGAFGKDGAKLPKGARLEFDVDGAAIHPNAVIVGHGNVGSPNISVSPRDIEVIGGNLAHSRSATPDDSKFDMAGDFGEFRPKKRKSEKGGRTIETDVKQNEILLNPQLNRTEHHRTQAHEVAHAIDDAISKYKLGKLTKDRQVENELRQVYHEMVGENALKMPELMVNRNGSGRLSPYELGYRGKESIKAELVAEGIRAIMARPEYFKRVAPNAARALRRQIRETPKLNKWLHLNSLDADSADQYFGAPKAKTQTGDTGLDV